jgi:hypothetical protein
MYIIHKKVNFDVKWYIIVPVPYKGLIPAHGEPNFKNRGNVRKT